MAFREVIESVRSSGLLAGGRPVVVMASGGRDSTCLLDAAVALLGPGPVRALHVNYGLRDAAAQDEARCSELSASLGVELTVVRAAQDGPRPAGNLQAWARELRYSRARAMAEELGGLYAAAHTSSDQVETILYRLAASPGRRALLGMVAGEGLLVRPLLALSREQTTAYCVERGLSWREDESNSDERFARTRVRDGVVPALRAVHPAAEANVLRTAELLRQEEELLGELVAGELAGGMSISLERLAQMPPALARLVLIRMAEDTAGTFVPQAGGRVRELLDLGERGGPAELHVGGGVAAVIDRGVVRMVRLPPRRRGMSPAED